MDQLPAEQQEALRKTNTERLRLMAAKTGDVEEEKLETMDRTALLAIVVKDNLARVGTEEGAIARRASERIDTAKELELQLELKKLENKKAEIELERRRMELEDAKAQREHELRLAQANRRQGQVDENEEDATGGAGAEIRDALGQKYWRIR